MQNVSEQFKVAISQPSREIASKITFPDLVLDDYHIQKIDLDSALISDNDFEIGAAPMDVVRIELIEDNDTLINYKFENKECVIHQGIKVIIPNTSTHADLSNFTHAELSQRTYNNMNSRSIEYLPLGRFTVEKATRKNNVITLNCVDRMYKAEKEYVSDLMYPTTLLDILESACDQAGIELATTSFANADYVVPNEPVYEGITCRKIFAQVAELAGGYAKINRQGQLEIVTLGVTPARDITKDHYIDFKINEVANARIDKVIVKVGDERAEAGEGENIYTIVDNMFVQDPNNVVDALYSVLKNVSYTACTLKWQGDFSLDLGDKVTVDGNDTYVLSRKLTYTGGLREDYSAPAKSNIEKNSTGKGSLTLDIENVKTQIKVIDGEIKQTIERVENLVVGANNRLYDSQTEIPFGFNTGTGEVRIFRDQIHPYYKAVGDQNINLFIALPDSQFAEPLSELGEITISLDVMVDVDRTVIIDGKDFDVKGNRWTRIHVTKAFDNNTTRRSRVRNPFSRKRTRDIDIGTRLIDSLEVNINTLYYRNLKVERGNIATDWTLTPEELEVDVSRYGSEIRQLADSISSMVRKDELSTEFMQNAESIVAAINTTDGVGRVKTVNFIVDENGATVENGALIVRDSQNAAIITSDGLRVMYIFTSSGELEGWQRSGIWDAGGTVAKYPCSLNVYIPDDLIIDTATLYIRSMPSRWEGHSNVPNGFYHTRNMRLYKGESASDGFLDWPWGSSYWVFFGTQGRMDITTPVLGGPWSPSGEGIKIKTGDIKPYLTVGESNNFIVETSDSASSGDPRYMGAMQLEIVITGFLRG
jgi:hypothetical protein